jgi:hypothetical protein
MPTVWVPRYLCALNGTQWKIAAASGRGVQPQADHARASAFRTLVACQRPPRGVGTPRALRASAMARKVSAPDLRISAMIGSTLLAARSASAMTAATAALRAASILGLPSLTPFALAAASADFVRPEIKVRSFSASAVQRCRTKGSTSGPSSATRKGTRCAIRPEMKCTSRERRSSLATATEQRSARALANAAANCGRRSSASLPLPVSTSTNSATGSNPSSPANRASASRCASMPRPERPCWLVLTRMYATIRFHERLRGLYKTYTLVLIYTSSPRNR